MHFILMWILHYIFPTILNSATLVWRILMICLILVTILYRVRWRAKQWVWWIRFLNLHLVPHCWKVWICSSQMIFIRNNHKKSSCQVQLVLSPSIKLLKISSRCLVIRQRVSWITNLWQKNIVLLGRTNFSFRE